MAVMFITHDMGVVAEIADEIAVMRYGKVVERGDPLAIFERPQHDLHPRACSTPCASSTAPRAPPRHARRAAARRRRSLEVEALRKEFTLTSGFLGLKKDDASSPSTTRRLELRAGENLGIVGESGSGKTTLGRCIQRVHRSPAAGSSTPTATARRPTSRRSRSSELRRAWRDIRMVFQDPFSSLNPRMTVGQIIGEPLLVSRHAVGRRRCASRVAELLDLVGLPAIAMERYPHAFSGGQRQRIGIARAIAPEPRIIIADEATSALDVSLRIQILDLLLDLQERLGISFLFISHDIAVIRYFCDRIAVMHRGQHRRDRRDRGGLHRPAAPLHPVAALRRARRRPAPPRHDRPPPLRRVPATPAAWKEPP